MSPPASVLLAATALLSAVACGGEPADPDAGAPAPDAADADAGPPSDAGTDASMDPPDGGAPDGGASCPATERDLWVWDDAVVTEPAARAALFSFAAERDVRAVYVEGGALVMRDDDALASFLAEAAARCVTVDLLFGDPSWSRASEHGALLALVDRAIAVSAAAAVRPRGIHLDVEPYALPEWTTDRDALARDFLDLLVAVAAALEGTGLALSVDIAFWFDEVAIDTGGGARPLSELVQDIADRTVILAYRDHAAAPDGIVDHAGPELAYASSIGRPLVIGVETLCGLDPEKVTFCEEGGAVLERELSAARAALGGERGFDGFAVHHYGSYRDLGP